MSNSYRIQNTSAADEQAKQRQIPSPNEGALRGGRTVGGAIAPGSGAEARAGTAGKETSVGEGQGVAHPQLLVELRFTQVLSRDYGYVLCSAK